MMNYLNLFVLSLAMGCQVTMANNVLFPTADASIRKDRRDQNFGSQSHMTVTKTTGANSRLSLMKFDTTHIDMSDDVSAKLILYVSGTDEESETNTRTVTISRVEGNFEEDAITWDSYSDDQLPYNPEKSVSFEVHDDHIGKAGHIEISSLMESGDDTLMLAIHVEDGGHVKVASKDHPLSSRAPRLLVQRMGDDEM